MDFLRNYDLENQVLSLIEATKITSIESVQELWSGYGRIVRVALQGASVPSVIAKQIYLPQTQNHPRGWNTDFSHQRKVRSYEIETHWYQNWADQCAPVCRIPNFLGFSRSGDHILLLLEDLNESGFPKRETSPPLATIRKCLEWLARFHGLFMNSTPEGLWDTGTYWHLATRPDEWKELDDLPLKNAASEIDAHLTAATHQTLVHGDAKLANFCFSSESEDVAMVDFQYIGGGCGMKDVAYFLGSCLDEESCEAMEQELLSHYFEELEGAIRFHHPTLDPDSVVTEWKTLYSYAWTDFHRFLKGWCPGHWKINGYSERLAREVIGQLKTKS